MTERETQERRSAIRALLLMYMWQMPQHFTLEEIPWDKMLQVSTETPCAKIAEEMTPEAYFRLLNEYDLMDYHVKMLEMKHDGLR